MPSITIPKVIPYRTYRRSASDSKFFKEVNRVPVDFISNMGPVSEGLGKSRTMG